MERYLKEIMVRHGAFTSFRFRPQSGLLPPPGFLKTVRQRTSHATAGFRVREMPSLRINLDPDRQQGCADHFINYRVTDQHFIGATGIGLTAAAVQMRIDHTSSATTGASILPIWRERSSPWPQRTGGRQELRLRNGMETVARKCWLPTPATTSTSATAMRSWRMRASSGAEVAPDRRAG